MLLKETSITLRRHIRELITENEITVLDMQNVLFISRAVADEIIHQNVPVKNTTEDVEQMIIAVSDYDSIQEYNCSCD